MAGAVEFRGRLKSIDRAFDPGLPVQIGLANGNVYLHANDLELGAWPTSSVEVTHRGGRSFTLAIEDELWLFVAEDVSRFMFVGLDLLRGDSDSERAHTFLGRKISFGWVVLLVALAFVVGAAASFTLVSDRTVQVAAWLASGLIGGVLAFRFLSWLARRAEEVVDDEGQPTESHRTDTLSETPTTTSREDQSRMRRLTGAVGRVGRAVGVQMATILRSGVVGGGSQRKASRERLPLSERRGGLGVADGLSYEWRGMEDGLDILNRFLPPADVRQSIERPRPESASAQSGEASTKTRQDDMSGDEVDDSDPQQEPGQGEPEAGKVRDEIDDLTLIKGIGPVSERALNELGYRSFLDLTVLGEEDLPRVQAALGQLGSRMKRDKWTEQAARLFFKKHRKSVADDGSSHVDTSEDPEPES